MHRLASLLMARVAIAVAVVALMLPGAAVADTRVALIIANSHYAAFDKLTNPSADALLIEAALKKVGFTDIMVREDLGRDAMNRALQEFGNKADKADVALIYYAGHGVEVDHTNYLVPVDVLFAHERDVDIEAIRLDTALAVTENARQMRMVIIDACRTDLVDKMGKSSAGVTSKGLQTVDPTKGLLVWLSAKGNTPAYDGKTNSPFAQSLARRITEPGKEVSKLFNEVRDDVLQTTEKKQEPVPYGTSQDFFFVSPVTIAAVTLPAPPVLPTIDIEKENWEICKSSLSTSPCESYLASYPKGLYARLAHMKVADITTTAAANQASVASTVAALKAEFAASMQAPAASKAPVAVVANTMPAVATGGGGGSVGAARSANIGYDVAPAPPPPGGFAIVAPASAPLTTSTNTPSVTQASAPAVNSPAVNASVATAPVIALATPPIVAPTASAPVVAPVTSPAAVAAASTPTPAVVAPPTPRPVQVAMLTPPPAPTPTAAVLVPVAAPVVFAHPAAPVVPVVPTSSRVGDLGITVRYDKTTKGILVDAIDRNAPFVAGKLFLGDLIMKIGTAMPDAGQAPDSQLAASWKSDGRLKLLVKRGDAVSVVMILSN